MAIYTLIDTDLQKQVTFRGESTRDAVYNRYLQLGIRLLQVSRESYERVFKGNYENVVYLVKETNF